MTLIKSISGIRGTIGGAPGENLTPLDLVKFTSAYGRWLRENNGAAGACGSSSDATLACRARWPPRS